MSFLEVRCQVRPQKVALIVRAETSPTTFVKGLDLLATLWAGRFATILTVGNQSSKEKAISWLSENRPEVVIGLALGASAKGWKSLCNSSCQPHVFVSLRSVSAIAAFLKMNAANLPTATEAVDHYVDQRFHERLKSVFWEVPASSKLAPYIKSVFGVPWHYDSAGIAEFFGCDLMRIRSDSFLELLRAYSESVRRMCWLDVTSHALSKRVNGPGGLATPPTVVLVSKLVSDLALFWNLRATVGESAVSRIIPIPKAAAFDRRTVKALRTWLSSTPANSTYVEITSFTATNKAMQSLARRLRAGLRGLPFNHVLVRRRHPLASTAYAFDRRLNVPVDISEDVPQVLSIRCPAPSSQSSFRSRSRWCVDLEGTRNGRRLGEFTAGGRKTLIDLLRAPFPPRLGSDLPLVIGESDLGVSLRPNSPDDLVQVALPTSQEALESLLRGRGLKIRADEKRSVYEKALAVFGGLEQAGTILRGDSLRILLALAKDGRVTLSDLQRELRLGKKLGTQPALPARVSRLVDKQESYLKPVIRERFANHLRGRIVSSDASAALFEDWTFHGVVSPQLRLGPCPQCSSLYWVNAPTIGNTPHCMSCSGVLAKSLVAKGYSLHPDVRLAIKEGLVPVVLTAAYLKRCSRSSFMWLPGVKGKHEGDWYDIDVLAMVDGRLFVSECKRLLGVPIERFKSDILNQLKRLVGVARTCRADSVLLASLADSYPPTYSRFARGAEDSTMAIRLLSRQALEAGFSQCSQGNRLWGSTHLLPKPKRPRRGKKKRRSKRGYQSWL